MTFFQKIKSWFSKKPNIVASKAQDYLKSEQYIFNKCFVNNTLRLKAGGFYSSQDYLNAVFDENSDSLRVSLDGPSGGVTSVFGRTDAVLAQTGDYSFNQISGNVNTIQMPVSGDWKLTGNLNITNDADPEVTIFSIDKSNKRIGVNTETPNAPMEVVANGEAFRFSLVGMPTVYGSFGGYGASYVGLNLVDPTGLILNEFSFGFESVKTFGVKKTGLLTVYVADYETLVISDDDIPNKKYVDDKITIGTTAKNYNSDGIAGQMSYNSGYLYVCVVSGTGGSGRWVRNAVETSAF